MTNPLRGGRKKVRIITTPNGIGNKAHDIWVRNYSVPGSAVSTTSGASKLCSNFSTAPIGVSPMDCSETSGGTPDVAVETTALPAHQSQWSCHFVDIYTAVKEGLSVDIDELKAAVDDPEGWAQEFECQFLDMQTVLLPYELMAACESAEASATVPPGYWEAQSQFTIDMGIDFGCRRDLTVCYELFKFRHFGVIISFQRATCCSFK